MLRTRPAARRAALAVIAAFVAALAIGPATASAKKDRELTVMTYNLYLGSSLDPALQAGTDGTAFVTAVARIFGTTQFTNFPARAQAIADIIEEEEPDVIGLQEVSKWTVVGGPGAPSGYDFLQILQDALDARGLNYAAASTANNADITAPLVASGCPQIASPPFFTCQVSLLDRDVILVNEDTPGLSWNNPKSGRYAAQQTLPAPGGQTLSFDRGWASIDARLKNKPFKFVNTHLEVEGFAAVQEAQAAEFLSGPAKGGTVIATGDFNSAADGSTTTSYAQLTAPGKFRDAWDEDDLGPGHTCCQVDDPPFPLAPGALTNTSSTLGTRIDLILSRAAARSTGDAEVIGDVPIRLNPFLGPPFWPSDHAGVVADIRLNG